MEGLRRGRGGFGHRFEVLQGHQRDTLAHRKGYNVLLRIGLREDGAGDEGL